MADIDIKKESPVGHGRMICFSVYCGPEADFGDGKSRLWVDVLGKDEVLDEFKSYFEDRSIKKVRVVTVAFLAGYLCDQSKCDHYF